MTNAATLMWIALAGLTLEAVGLIASVVWLFAVISTKNAELERRLNAEIDERDKAITAEREAREKGEAETRAMAEAASKSASVLSNALLGEINDELKRMRYEHADVRATLLGLVKNVAEAEGRRQVYEHLVEKLLDK